MCVSGPRERECDYANPWHTDIQQIDSQLHIYSDHSYFILKFTDALFFCHVASAQNNNHNKKTCDKNTRDKNTIDKNTRD